MTPPRASISWLIKHAPTLHSDWIRFFEDLTHEYGDIVYCRFPGVPLCVINHPRYIESVLASDHSRSIKSKNYRALSRLLGNGLIVSNGEFWRQQRRLVQPAFHRELISGYVEIMTVCAERMMEDWRRRDTVDLHQEMMRLTLEIASDTLLGADMRDQSATVMSTLHALMQQYAGLAIYLVPSWIPSPNNLRTRLNVGKIDRLISEIIRARKDSAEERTDLLSILLSARDDEGQGMTDAQLRDEVVTLFLAGHETTANALSWTWYLLARHPQIDARMVAELWEVLGDRRPILSDAAQLPYTTLVIKESMRLYPPVGGIGREALTKLQIGEYEVPAGTNIFMSQWLMHRNARYYDEPEAFRPERWTSEFERQLPAFAYFPFGGGPHLCVGASLALTEMVVLLATIARKFRFKLCSKEPIKPVFSISLRPEGGVKVFVSQGR